jgi:hypothetical protein
MLWALENPVLGEVVDTVEPCRRSVGDRVLAFSTGYIRMVSSAHAAFLTATGVSPDILPLQGGFCQYILSFETATVAVPRSVPHASFDPLHYVVAQPLGTIIRAVSKLGSLWGKHCAVLGCGQNGLLMTALLSAMGARTLVALDLFANRVAAVREHPLPVRHAILCVSCREIQIAPRQQHKRPTNLTGARQCNAGGEDGRDTHGACELRHRCRNCRGGAYHGRSNVRHRGGHGKIPLQVACAQCTKTCTINVLKVTGQFSQ